MSHTIRQKARLSQRVARIRGQVDAIARALDAELECGEVLRRIASARGAMNSLMAVVVEVHDVGRIGGVALIAALVWFRVWEPFPRVSVLGLLGTLAGGWPIFHEAWTNIRERRM